MVDAVGSSDSARNVPALSVLIVNYNSTELLRLCIDALRASSISGAIETIVVDNASSDFEVAAMRGAYPEVIWLAQERNLTFTGGANLAYENSSSDLILLLNPDTQVEPDALGRALAFMGASPHVVALSAYLIGPDGRLQRYYRRLPSLADVPVILFERLLRRTRRARQFLMLDEDFEGTTVVEQPPGAFLLVRRMAVRGRLLDAGYQNFVSDLDLCERLNHRGQIVVRSDVRCHHLRAGAGLGTRDPASKLKLYHDLTWGLRRYFAPRISWGGRAFLETMLALYWVSRLGHVVLRHPSMMWRGFATAISAMAGRQPVY